MSLLQLVPPAEEPISLSDLKAHLRVAETAEDAALQGFIRAARRAVEARGGLSLVSQKWRLSFDAPPARVITLPRAPVAAIDAVAAITDAGAQAVAADLYAVDIGATGRLKTLGPWPSGRTIAGYRIDFTAGWPSAAAVPEELKLALRMLAGHFFENREGAQAERIFAVPQAVDALIAPFRQVRL
jgi:uncharacterized phiE125 gp8 family phage protein